MSSRALRLPMFRLVAGLLGEARAHELIAGVAPMLPATDGASDDALIDRTGFAAALNLALYADLLARVPEGAAYVRETHAQGRQIVLDHGALRTVLLPADTISALPNGITAFARILEPLGYGRAAVYPLPRLRMVGHAFCHRDHPLTLPQFFVSELDVAAFPDDFIAAARAVFAPSRDPLDPATLAVLAQFAAGARVPLAEALPALRVVLGAFDRQHPIPALGPWRVLAEHSAEAAWIATEGQAFNHVTDRVDDVEAVAAAQRSAGRSIKPAVEVSANGRIRQTALRAATVKRDFVDESGHGVTMDVPGSFFEFITRSVDPATGQLDLGFDSSNATGIFHMTRAA